MNSKSHNISVLGTQPSGTLAASQNKIQLPHNNQMSSAFFAYMNSRSSVKHERCSTWKQCLQKNCLSATKGICLLPPTLRYLSFPLTAQEPQSSWSSMKVFWPNRFL